MQKYDEQLVEMESRLEKRLTIKKCKLVDQRFVFLEMVLFELI